MARHRPRTARRLDRRAGAGRLARAGRLLRGLLAATVLVACSAGVPWSLVVFVGWPLPHQVPSWADVETTLTSPMSTTLLLNVLALVLWPVWAAFVIDVTQATAEVTRGMHRPELPDTGPLQSMAAALVSAVALSLIFSRTATLAAQPGVPRARVVATATATPVHVPFLQAHFIDADPQTASPTQQQAGDTPGTVQVRGPRAGVYDSLWRIADRTLGDGARWPEIYALNHGRPQPDGQTLINPNIIRPGWTLRIPTSTAHCGSEHRRPQKPAPASPTPATSPPTIGTPAPISPARPDIPPTSATPPSSTISPSPPHSSRMVPPGARPAPPGISLPTGAFVGTGLAAVVAAALLTARRRRRMHYRPGSGDREDLAIAPVVRALRIAHDQASAEGAADDEPGTIHPDPPDRPNDPTALTPARGGEPPIGVKDGQLLAWNLARTRGLGLTGPGAPDAVRALLINLLAQQRQTADHPVKVLIPAADAHHLLGQNTDNDEPLGGLRIVSDLDRALDVLETQLLTRTRAADAPSAHSKLPKQQDLVLVTRPAEHADRRLQAVLDNGSTLGLAGVLLGQWKPGGTARVREDGTVAAVSPSISDALAGARLFTLPSPDAEALLDLFSQTQPPQRPPLPSIHAGPSELPRTPERPPPSSRSTPPHQDHPRRRPGQGSNSEAIRRQPPSESVPSETETGSDPEPAAEASDETDPSPSPSPEASSDETQTPAHTDQEPLRPLHLTVLGRIRLTHHQAGGTKHADLSQSLAPKHREVLTYLALHEDGVRREVLATAIWPDAPRDRPYNSFHATLSQLRRSLRTATHDEQTEITVQSDGHYALDHRQITVDLWQLQKTLKTTRHDPSRPPSAATIERVIELYRGDLAAGLATEWLDTPREALRRDVLDAISLRARAVRDAEPEQALSLLEHARTLDPYTEALYRDIARLQATLGQRDAIPRTFALLTTTLAEIDEQPSPETAALFDALRRHQAPRADPSRPTAPSR